MSAIRWDDGMCLGIERIDEQHKKLTGLINELYVAFTAGRDRDILSRLIREISDYCLYHFSDEERLMAETGYPDTEHHTAQHRTFVHKTVDFLVDAAEGKEDLSLEVLDFLTDWWIGHIQGTDVRLGEYLKAQGLS